ncbi:hypothetical protein [Streptomyces liangshanensis]|uniref:hypothetical protein n=1 Tax=Streptomyces liangshanensis TaxID=2717324 RepID=UPI0036DF7D3B
MTNARTAVGTAAEDAAGAAADLKTLTAAPAAVPPGVAAIAAADAITARKVWAREGRLRRTASRHPAASPGPVRA